MNVLVAGGTGFVGRHVTDALRGLGHRVVVLSRGRRAAGDLAVDLGRHPLPELPRVDAIVNLVGIKREEGTQTFEAVHVEVTRRLIDAARASGIRRLVHLSVVCSRPDPGSGYHDSKWRAEELVRKSGLDFTILKPGVIYGPGDDMVTHLVKMLRFAPVFPVVGHGDSVLQPVDVRDVAQSVAAALERPVTIGRSYEVVGPARLSLREVVGVVAEGARLPVSILPTPLPLQRLAVGVMNGLSRNPLSTPAQLRMLGEGLYGDPEPARRDLGLHPRAFTAAAVAELSPPIPSLFGFSLRLIGDDRGAAWLASVPRPLAGPLALVGLGLAAVAAASAIVSNVWWRMAVVYLLLLPITVRSVRLDWRALFEPRGRWVAQGLIAAGVLYALGRVVFELLGSVPGFSAQFAVVQGWKSAAPPFITIPLLLFIVLGEEVVWRAGVTLPLAGRLGAGWGVLAGAGAFAIAHAGMGLGLLVLLGFAAGLFWNLLLIKTGSAVPGLVCHLVFDLAVLFLLPYS